VDLDRIKNEFNCDVLVSLMRLSEMRDVGISNLFTEAKNRGMESISFPIKDKWIPNSMPKLISLVELIITKLKERKTVIVHCNGGKGRSGTIVVATLVGLVKKVDNAIKVVRKTRSGTIRNPVQIAYLGRFQKIWKKRNRMQSIVAGLKYEFDDEISEEDIIENEELEKYLHKMEKKKYKNKKIKKT